MSDGFEGFDKVTDNKIGGGTEARCIGSGSGDDKVTNNKIGGGSSSRVVPGFKRPGDTPALSKDEIPGF